MISSHGNSFIQSSKAKKPIKKISEFNRLIAHSENFFSFWIWSIYRWIYFNNNEKFIPSYGLVPNNRLNEINFLIKLIKRFIKINIIEKQLCLNMVCVRALAD